MDNKQKVYFPNLDGLRFIAFFIVYIYHGFGEGFHYLPHSNPLYDLKLGFLGGMGVSVFFVLSGFLITYLLLKEKEATGTIHVKAFYLRRTLRIWPLYYIVIVFIFLIYPALQSLVESVIHTASRPWYFYTFLSNFDVINTQKYFDGNDLTMSNNTWSVAVEEQFYLLWPLLLYFIPAKHYAYIFFTVIIASFTFRWINQDDPVTLYFHSLSVCGDLALGGLAAYYSLYSKKFMLYFENMTKSREILHYAFFILVMLMGHFFPFLKYHAVFGRLVFISLCAFFLLIQNFSPSPLFKLSSSRFISFWGKYTYGLYLLHPLVLVLVSFVFNFFSINARVFSASFAIGIIAFFISLLISYLSYHYYEEYFLRLKSRFSYINKPVTESKLLYER